ncbi:hypothetical protein T439DRAFT_358199 [Meredithblackwellia eburnea MCA 4105]
MVRGSKSIPGMLIAEKSAATARQASDALEVLKRERDSLKIDKDLAKERLKKARTGSARNTGPSSTSQPSTSQEFKAGPVIPGVTRRAVAQPGQKGFAGNANRVGVVARDKDDFDDVSDSD